MENHNHPPKVKDTQSRTLIFLSFLGDVLMILEDVCKEIKWSVILEKIVKESWFQACEKWRFVFDDKNLELDDVLESDDDTIKITCVKVIVPLISFVLESGELLVSIPFEDCKTLDDDQVYVIDACLVADKKLKTLGKNGYGTYRTRYPPLVDTSIGCDRETLIGEICSYHFNDRNGRLLGYYDILENPGEDNLVIFAAPKNVYCENDCHMDIYERLNDRERARYIGDTLVLCHNCSLWHCPSCGMYADHEVGTYECRR